MTSSLLPWSIFAAMIAVAGLPIYIHAPKFFVDEYGVSLAALGGVLALLRLIDVVQDPALGWLAERFKAQRAAMVTIAGALMGGAMLALFAVPPPVAPLLWFAITLTVLFSAYSFLTIVFYAQGVARANSLGPRGHTRLAGWRETGALIGVCVAAVAPVVLVGVSNTPFATFAFGFAMLCAIGILAMRRNWDSGGSTVQPSLAQMFGPALRDRIARNLLILALINAAPVAVTSTLFLFFVQSRLGLPDLAGVYLLAFFLSAAVAAPIFSKLAVRYDVARVLMAGMALSIATFLWAITLGTGDGLAFVLICVASGAALGADMVLLPAMFARRMGQIGSAAAGFGMYSFVSKLSLALAAATLLPALQLAGYAPSGENTPSALWALSLAYAGLPCALKAVALIMLARIGKTLTRTPEGSRK